MPQGSLLALTAHGKPPRGISHGTALSANLPDGSLSSDSTYFSWNQTYLPTPFRRTQGNGGSLPQAAWSFQGTGQLPRFPQKIGGAWSQAIVLCFELLTSFLCHAGTQGVPLCALKVLRFADAIIFQVKNSETLLKTSTWITLSQVPFQMSLGEPQFWKSWNSVVRCLL